MKPTDSNQYRPDIDGLRALAVVLVVLFHTDLAFPGGYIGVDVFFVISGFLITRLILSEINHGQFSLAGFWVKRVRRIAPVLLVVLLTVLALGLTHLWPDDLKLLSQSALSVLSIVSNWYFWSGLGYFDAAASAQPLLHTWSLAVEEQFYLVYPFVLVLLTRHRFRSKLLPLLIVLTLFSFSLSVLVWLWSPSAAFYFLPPRAWELLVGALLACNLHRPALKPLDCNAVALSGLLGIIACAIFYNESTPFPALGALVPVIGSAAIVYAGAVGNSFVTTLLSLKPIVFIGLISYSLYLWHWPLLLFARIRYPDAQHLEWKVVAVSVMLSIVTWKFVEQPFRRSSMPVKRLLVFIALAVTAALGICVLSYSTNGLPGRHAAFATLERNSEFEVSDADLLALSGVSLGRNNEVTQNSKVAFLVIGDSHAAMMLPMFDQLAAETGVPGLSLARAGRKPFGGRTKLKPITQAITQMIELHQPQAVFLAARWSSLFGETVSASEYADNLALVSSLVDAGRQSDTTILLLSQIPDYQLPRAVLRYQITSVGSGLDNLSYPDIDHGDLRKRTESVSNAFDQLVAEGASLLDLSKGFYDAHGVFSIGSSSTLLYWDNNHLTQAGASELLTDILTPVMQKLANTR